MEDTFLAIRGDLKHDSRSSPSGRSSAKQVPGFVPQEAGARFSSVRPSREGVKDGKFACRIQLKHRPTAMVALSLLESAAVHCGAVQVASLISNYVTPWLQSISAPETVQDDLFPAGGNFKDSPIGKRATACSSPV
jgi:hypothetical protein